MARSIATRQIGGNRYIRWKTGGRNQPDSPGAPRAFLKFDPFANEENFLLGAFIFEDVGVTAYRGSAKLLSNADYIKAAAGILAVEGLHAGLVRTILFGMRAEVRNTAEAISALRDKLDGLKGKDQGVLDNDGAANIVPIDANGLCASRSVNQVLNIVYGVRGADRGGFCPVGENLLVPYNA